MLGGSALKQIGGFPFIYGVVDMMSYNFYGGGNFTGIREAIDNAIMRMPRVLVYNGTYFENVVIYMRLTCIDLIKIKF